MVTSAEGKIIPASRVQGTNLVAAFFYFNFLKIFLRPKNNLFSYQALYSNWVCNIVSEIYVSGYSTSILNNNYTYMPVVFVSSDMVISN